MLQTEYDLLEAFHSEESCLNYLIGKNILKKTPCLECGNATTLHAHSLKCKKKNCRNSVSILRDTIFYKSHVPIHKAMKIAYLWLCGINKKAIKMIIGVSKNAILKLTGNINRIFENSIRHTDNRIGGPNIIVEIDEAKFGKVKYHRGHRVDGVWILGGVERTEQRRLFLVVIRERTASTLLDAIQKNVHSGSIIYTDCWRGYRDFSSIGMTHLTVNHSRFFKDPISGCCTNTIEGTWAAVKGKTPLRNRTHNGVKMHLMKFIWERTYQSDLWTSFLRAIFLDSVE